MPQTANSCHFFIRRGGYEPSFGLHTNALAAAAMTAAGAIVSQIVDMLPTTVQLSRIEYQNPLGEVLDEVSVEEPGTWAWEPADFTDCIYFRWASAGPENASSCFIHPRPGNSFVNGLATVSYLSPLTSFISAVSGSIWTDSEGFDITGISRVRPSRRRRVRVAP
jgi:hypothetical protein